MNKKFLLSTVLSAIAAFTIGTAKADEFSPKTKEILFKIHDITPNKNKDGIVKSCNFFVTFYNRTDHSLDNATLDLSWKDSTGNYIITQNNKDIANRMEENGETPSFKTADNSSIKAEVKNVGTFLEMPALEPYTQGTVAARLNSEKCFLLFEDLNYRVTSCNIKNQNVQSDQGANKSFANSTEERSIESCSRLFKYVSPKDAEYYREFKAVPVAEQQKMLENAAVEDLEKIETKFNGVISNLEKTNNVLDNIR